MTEEENYCFDTAGYLIVRGVLTRAEIEACNKVLDEVRSTDRLLACSSLTEIFRNLLVHPTLVMYLNQICGPGFRLDDGPTLIRLDDDHLDHPLRGSNEPREPSRAYYYQNQRRICQAVRAIWALDDIESRDGGFVLVPCSHKSNVEPPQDLMGKDDMDVVFQPALEGGDLLLCAESTLQGIRSWKTSSRKRLLSYHYAARAAVRSTGSGRMTEAESNLP